MLKIVYKCRDFIIVNKPVGMPSQSDPSGDPDAMSVASEMLSENGESGALWLIHRLDRVVGGLLVFARSRAAAADLSSLAANGGLYKRYFAVTEGLAESGTMHDYIFKDSNSSRAIVSDRHRGGFKEALLEYSQKASVTYGANTFTLVDIFLKTGRFHQIRAQFSSRKMPLVGDKKYGSRDLRSRQPALFAYGLAFEYKKQNYSFKTAPELGSYPWNLFSNEFYPEETI